LIQEGVITVEKNTQRGALARRDRHTLSLLNIACRSRLADAPQRAPFAIDIWCVIQEGVITVEKSVHRGASARRERHTLSLGQNIENRHG